MRKKIKKWTKWLVVYPLLIPISYFIVSFVLTCVPYNRFFNKNEGEKVIYISSNGVHLDVIIPKADMDKDLLSGLETSDEVNYFSFGWGDENFYINTPTWNDLTLKNATEALFLKSTTLMHVTNYSKEYKKWIKINCSKKELDELQSHILTSFNLDENGGKQILIDKGYTINDSFYRANGNYSCLKTCNSWVNELLKKSGMKSCLWTPYNFGVLWQYS